MSHIDRDTQSIWDILRFVLTFARRHRSSKDGTRWKPVSTSCASKLHMWRGALVAWLAKLADKIVLALYLDKVESMDLAAPAMRFNNADKRKYTIVSVEAKWEILEDARATHAAPVTVLALRSKLAECGCHKDAADAWLRKEQQMYLKATCSALSSGASHAS